MAVPAQSAGDFGSVSTQAAAAREQHDVPKAIQLYSQAVALDPRWAEGWWSLGNLDYATDQYPEARAALTHFIELTPTAGPALALRGLCEYESALYPEALQDLQQGIALGAASQPRNAPIVLYHEALLLTRLGRFEEATVKYQSFVQHASVNPELTLAIGLAGLRMPLLPKEVDASQAEILGAVGSAAIPVMNGDLAAGKQAFDDLFRQYPTTPNLHYFYGYLLYSAHFELAVPQFEQEVAIAPHSAVGHAMLAWAYGLQGDFTAVLPVAEKAVAEDPSNTMGQLMYGRSLIETGEVEAGLPHLEQVLSQDPNSLEAHLSLAKAYSKLGRSTEARRERLLCLRMAAGPAAPGQVARQQVESQGAASNATP